MNTKFKFKKMEDPICKNTSSDNQNENVNPSVGREDLCNSTAVFPAEEISSGTKGNLDIVIENKYKEELNGYNNVSCKSPTNCDSLQMSELANKKTCSPTLIESAIKVVKNLFSPEKVTNNTSSATSQSNYSKSASVSPCISTGITDKANIFASESESKIYSNPQITSGENSFKSFSQNSESDSDMLQTPIILDQNNTDESFITSVSFIDDSFHSAVTNLDEQGDFTLAPFLKKDNFLNSSLISDFMNPTDGTLENNDSCLENTMLKIDNLSSDGIQFQDFSVRNKDQSIKNLSSPQINGRNLYPIDSGKVSSIQLQYDKCSNQSEKDSKSIVLGSSPEINSEERAAPDVGYEGNFEKPPPFLEMADIYLNKLFVKQPPSEQCEIFTNGFDKNIQTKIEGSFNLGPETDKGHEIGLKSSYNEDSCCVNNSISTTTIVLGTGQSLDLENRLMTLKTDDSDTTISTSTFEDDNSDCWLKKEISQYNLQRHSITGKICHLRKDQRSCVSEGNSPNTSGSILAKLYKSDELLNRKMFSEPFEESVNSVKSPLNFSLGKYSETSKLPKKSDHVKFQKNFKQSNDSKINKRKVGSPSNDTNMVPVISQQSYTVLNIHDKSLNRPVIESFSAKNSTDPSEQAFQKEDSDQMLSTDLGIVEKCENNCANGSFDTEDLVKSSEAKHSTPLWEINKEFSKKIFQPTTLKLHSPELPESVCGDTKIIDDHEQSNLLSEKSKQIFSTNESLEGFSPVKPDGDNNDGDETGKNNQMITTFKEQNKINQSPQLKPKKSPRSTGQTAAQNLNQTFDKKQSPFKSKDYEKSEPGARKPLNQKFKSLALSSSSPRKETVTSKQDKLNLTFEMQDIAKSARSANSSTTFTKETRSPEIDEANLTFDILESLEPSLMNKTYDKPLNHQSNQTFCKNTESPGLEKLNETFDKKSEPSLVGIQVSDRILESGNESNKTFVMDVEKAVEEPNLIINIKESEMLESLSKVENTFSEGNKTYEKVTEIFKKPVSSEDQLHLSSNFPLPLLDYRTNNNPECDGNDSSTSTKSSNISMFCSDLSTVVFNEEDGSGNLSIDELSEKLGNIDLNDNNKQLNHAEGNSFLKEAVKEQTLQTEDNLLSSLKDDKLRCDSDLVELIREQFSSNDIEKICSVVQELYPSKLTNDILKASEQFDKSFYGNATDLEFKLPEVPPSREKTINALSPQSFDFLNSIRGKPTGRDLSRESLYVKFDPLVQPSANSLIDFTKEGEPLAGTDTSPVNAHSSSICEQLLTISPQKKPDAIVPPLTPLSHKVKADSDEGKLERLKALQNEIYFLKNLYAERERSNKTKMEEYENQIAKLTGESCMLEDKLKNSKEREKSLVKKMNEQTQSIGQLKIIMEEYVKVISKLSSELEAIKSENLKQLETLSLEKDSYMTHLQNTEAAFTDVHAKYEKSKKTIVSMKANETSYKNTIAEQAQKIEEFILKAKEAQEKALSGFQKIQEELNQTKANHSQEAARLKAQLRKTELKVEALQESLDQKIKENQQLTAICDELIEGKK